MRHNETSILDLAQGWRAEDNRIRPQFSEAEMSAVADLLYGNCGDTSKRSERIRSFMTGTGSAGVLTADVAGREMQALYTHAPRVMRNVCRVREGVPTPNQVSALRFDGAEEPLAVVLEGAEYGQVTVSQSDETYKCIKHGRLFQFTMEAQMSDPVGFFETLPTRMSRAALRTEEAFLTSLFFGASGPSTAYFTQQTGAAPATLTLTADNLSSAVGQMLNYTDAGGDPVVADPVYLMVPPALKIQAMEILNSINLAYQTDTSGSGTGTPQRFGTRNVLADLNLRLLVNPWIKTLATTANGDTSWALFCDPANIPAGELGLVQGWEIPRVDFAGPDDPARFYRDVMSYKVSYWVGGTTIDKRAGWASTGAGS